MNRAVQAKIRQDLVIGAVGGTRLHGSFRVSDTLVAVLGTMRAIAGLGLRDHNLASAATDMLIELSEDFPLSVTEDGEPTEAVAAEAAALVEDPEALEALGAMDAKDSAWQALEDLVGQADCFVDGEDGLAIFAWDGEPEDY